MKEVEKEKKLIEDNLSYGSEERRGGGFGRKRKS
jgi:hypothetical protein